jgi:hypothetical protein
MELRKEQQGGHDPVSEMAGKTKQKHPEGKEGGISLGRMEAMISADTSLKEAKVQESVGTRLESRTAILETEIRQDKGSGADTSLKEAELLELQGKINSNGKEQLSALDGVNRELKEYDAEEKTEDITDKTVDDNSENDNQIASKLDQSSSYDGKD